MHPSQVTIAIQISNAEKAKEVFDKLQEGGEVIMPLQETFWSPAYGQVKDKFNIEWQVTTSTTEQKYFRKAPCFEMVLFIQKNKGDGYMGEIWYGGTIYTMREENAKVEAVYVENGIIVDAGNKEELESRYSNVKLHDLKGKQ